MKKKEKNIMNSRLAQSEIEDTSLSSQDKTLEARIIFGISLIFAIWGIWSNSFLLLDALKKAGIFVGFVLTLVFLCYPMKLAKKAHALRYFDYLLALLGMFSSCYLPPLSTVWPRPT